MAQFNKKLTFEQLGAKTYQELPKLGPSGRAFQDWKLFSKSFGFFQIKKKYNFTDEQIEEFRKGFESTVKNNEKTT